MKLINKVFSKYRVDYDKLIPFGFTNDNGIYSYSINIHNNSFRLVITITNDTIDGKLIDNEFNDIYTQIDIEDEVVSFISILQNEVEQELINIRNNCFIGELFKSKQANRVTKYINDKYSSPIEFLWDTFDDGIFRNQRNKKWFAIIMTINGEKLGINDNKLEVMNVKLESSEIDSLVNNKEYFRAYHMNKKFWITLVLDERLSDDIIFNLIDKSYNLIDKKK